MPNHTLDGAERGSAPFAPMIHSSKLLPGTRVQVRQSMTVRRTDSAVLPGGAFSLRLIDGGRNKPHCPEISPQKADRVWCCSVGHDQQE